MNINKTTNYISIRIFVILIFLNAGLGTKTTVKAQVFQHFDASIDSLVVTNSSNIITSWKDKSGNGYNALPAAGNAIYPSSKTFPNGLKGIDFRDSLISLQLLSAEASDTILNQEANPTGFSIITAVYIDENISNWNDLLGNNTSVSSGFFIRYSGSGKLQANLGSAKSNGTDYISPGQTVIFSFNYDAENGVFHYWCSATDEEIIALVKPADFSNNSPLTIGATNGTDRHFDGMVGEVQIYASSIAKAKRNEIIYEMGQKWGVELPRVPQKPNARIVTTKYSDSEVAVISFNAAEAPYNADKTGTADATKAIQSALDDAGNATGAVVYLPEGTYRLNGNLVMKAGVTLRGDWKEPTDNDKTVAGTVLNIYASKGEDSDDVNIQSPIELGGSGGIRDLTIFYPEQNASNPIPYPYTIRCKSTLQTVMNVTLVNSYKGIRYETSSGLAVGHPNVYNVYGSPLKKGIRLNKAAAVPRITRIDFDPAYWAESGLNGAPSETEIFNAQRSLKSVALELEQSDNGIIGGVHLKGYDVGIGIGTGGQSSNMKVYDFKIDRCRIGVHAVNYKSQGWTFTKGSIYSDGESAMAFYQTGEGIITFNDVTFNSTAKLIVSSTGSLSFTNCHFQDWQDNYGIYLANGSLLAFGNIFSKTLESGQANIYLNSGAVSAAISGNTFENSAAKIISMNTDTNIVVIDTTGEYEVYIHDYQSHKIGHYFMPAKVDANSLFNVLDFGAVGDMETENTAAFKAALQAAQENGGGTVYIPGGAYRIDGRLVVPTGVELRGVHDVPVYTGHARSILLSYLDKNNPGDSAFVTLQEGSGIRGLVVVRPEQVYNEADKNIGTTIYDWPYAIRAAGDNCSLVNIVVANADKGIDLASPGAGHYINWYLTAPIRMCLNVQTGANPIVVANMQTNPGLFRDIKSTLNWNLFSDNALLTSHFSNNIAPLASESTNLYPSGTASNIKGDGAITFYSNFYNNPFNGFIINGSPKMKSFLSGGEGEIFYTVESEGIGPIDLEIIANTYHPIETDPSITGFGSFQLNPNSSGIIKILNTTSFGAPNVGYRINNGKLIIQSAYQTVDMKTFVEAQGNASVSLQGNYLRNGMAIFHGVARNDSIDFGILGNLSQNRYRVSSSVEVSGSSPREVIKVDLSRPSTPLNLQAEAVSSSQIELNWKPSSDNINVAGYYIFRNGFKIAQVSSTNYSDSGLNADTFYDYFITAYDDAKNESFPSDTIAVSTAVVGVNNLNNSGNELILYPNPTTGLVFVSLPNTNDSELSIELFTASGTLVKIKKLEISGNKNAFMFDLSNYDNGIYIYRLTGAVINSTGIIHLNKH